MKTIGEKLDQKLAQDIHDYCDVPKYDKDGNEIKICKDCGCERCRCRPDDEY